MHLRGACADDLDRLLEIHIAAYPDPRGIEARRRNFMSHALGTLDDLRVAEEGGTLVGHAFLFALGVWFGAREVRVGGVASVAVAPEARGRGVAGALLEHIHAESLARGEPITLLYPFRQAFYARHGYAAVSPARRLNVDPRAIPRAWGTAREGSRIRAASGADRAEIVALYLRAAARATGWITRPETLWDQRFLDERRQWMVLERAGHLAGYAAWTASKTAFHAPVALAVHEIVADEESGRRALLGCLGAQRDQVTEASLDLAMDDPIDRAFVDADAAHRAAAEIEHPLGTVVGGPMVRVGDVARALEARGYLHDGALDLAIGDDPPLHLEVRDGAARVGPARGKSALLLDRATLARIAFGGLRVTDAARLGWLDEGDPRTVQVADALFALPPFFALDPF